MHPLVLEVLATQHIDDLHREAQRQRLAGAKRRRQRVRRPAAGIGILRALVPSWK